MEKVSFQEKHDWYNKMNQLVWSNKTVDAITKAKIDRQIKEIFGKNMTKQELNELEQKIMQELNNTKKETIEKVTQDLNDPKKMVGSDITSVNTITRPGGQVITSVQKNGSIYVKDSSYSGNINQVVEEVAQQATNKNMTRQELTEAAFNEMQKRQIVVNMQGINQAGLKEPQKKAIREMPNMSDGIEVNTNYGVAVDKYNSLVDIKNSNGEVTSYSNDNEKAMQMEKPKVLTLTRKPAGRGDAAFVDAALVGMVTLYAGLLGLCAIFSKM